MNNRKFVFDRECKVPNCEAVEKKIIGFKIASKF